MPDVRYSVMLLPRRKDGSILLQSWTEGDTATTDGFGSFYPAGGYPEQTAQKEFAERFGSKAPLTEAARLRYFISKPDGMVDLKVTVYFADAAENLPLQSAMHWFAPHDIPYAQMHAATAKWLPIILEDPELLIAAISVDQPGDHTTGKVTEFTVG